MPLLVHRQYIFEAAGADLLSDGFPLFPTGEYTHWTVVLAEPTLTQFARVRRHFSDPKRNPVWAGHSRR
jgi:hypothetical protein